VEVGLAGDLSRDADSEDKTNIHIAVEVGLAGDHRVVIRGTGRSVLNERSSSR